MVLWIVSYPCFPRSGFLEADTVVLLKTSGTLRRKVSLEPIMQVWFYMQVEFIINTPFLNQYSVVDWCYTILKDALVSNGY